MPARMPLARRSGSAAARWLCVAFVVFAGCAEEPDDPPPPAEPPWSAGDTARLAPAEGNSVGLYDLAVCPGHDEVFFTNLHVPAVGVASGEDGALLDVVDLRHLTNERVPLFATIECVPTTGSLLVNHRDTGELIRIDAVTHEVQEVLPVCTHTEWFVVEPASRDVFVHCGSDGQVVRLDGVTLEQVEAYDVSDRVSYFVPTESQLVFTDDLDEQVHRLDLQTGEVESTAAAGMPSQVAVGEDGAVFVAERLGGQVLRFDAMLQPDGEIPAGSDTFGLTAVPARGRIYAVARQGAEVLPGEPYKGEPGVVYALDPADGSLLAAAEVGKTPHFAVYQESLDRLYVGNEDSLSISAIGPDDRTLWTSPPLGLTLDHTVVDEATGRMWLPSHLSDQTWVVDWFAGQAVALDTPGWPFSAAFDPAARRVYVASQETTEVRAFDADSLEPVDEWDLGFDSHQLACDPLCTGHVILSDLALDADRGVAYVSHPPRASVLRLDLAGGQVEEIVIGDVQEPHDADRLQHMAVVVAPDTGRLFAYYPLADRLVAVDGGAVVAETTVDSSALRPLAMDRVRGHVLVGGHVYDPDLELVSELDTEGSLVAHLEGPDLYVIQLQDGFVGVDPESRQIRAEYAYAGMAFPPFLSGETRYAPVSLVPLGDGSLVLLVNVKEGTVEVAAPQE